MDNTNNETTNMINSKQPLGKYLGALLPAAIKSAVAVLGVIAMSSTPKAIAVLALNDVPVGTPQHTITVPPQLNQLGVNSLVPAGGAIIATSPLGTGTVIFPPTVANTGLFTFSGTEIVYRESTGVLDFLFQINNLASSLDSIKRITITGFAGFTTSVGFDATPGPFLPSAFVGDPLAGQPAGTFAPLTADRVTATTLGFDFNELGTTNQINPGTSSKWFVVHTNATAVTIGSLQAIDGGVAFVPVLVPIGASVPEPGTALAGLLTVGMCGLVRRRIAVAKA